MATVYSLEQGGGGGVQDFSQGKCITKEGHNWLVTQTNFETEYKEESFWLGNNIVWTAENTYHTYLHILQNTSCIRKPPVISGGGVYHLHPPL